MESNCDSKSCGHCLIFVADVGVAPEDLMALGQVVQMKRPVALLFTRVVDSQKMVEHFKEVDSSFPILILPEDQSGTLSI